MQEQRLATRVSTGTACDRCRRQKQRCDPARPCSNCANAQQECVTSQATRPAKRARTSLCGSPHRSNDSRAQSTSNAKMYKSTQQERTAHTDFPANTSSPSRSDHLRREQSIVADFASSDSTIDITRRVLQSHHSPGDRATFAIPGGDFRTGRESLKGYYPISALIGEELPPRKIIDALLDVYFYTVHWFSLVILEPTFRQRYEAIMVAEVAQTTDRPFLFLLLTVLVMSCHYARGIVHDELRGVDLDEIRTRYLKPLRNSFMDLLDEDNLEFVQVCILLGSYWLYWGKPRSSFSLLGAAIKSAQALSLHRQTSGRQPRSHPSTMEERKRVWWTVYTWDRFATVVYGRPLGINDRDCDASMPATFTEHLVDIQSFETDEVELSPYQKNLNSVYRIASPILESIHRIHGSNHATSVEMARTVKHVDEGMRAWCRDLPVNLDLGHYPDLNLQSSLKEKMHQLQALSLRLTYLNLMIVIHRPLLTDLRVLRKSRPHLDGSADGTDTGTNQPLYQESFDQCFSAALDVSRLGQSKPNLILLAGKTHLLSFLAMNIFASSVVLFICGSANILSNAAQEAKRGLSRNLKILKSLPLAGSLSAQCSVIVGDLIDVILETEREEMFLGPLELDPASEPVQHHHDHIIAFPLESHNGESRRPSAFQTIDFALPPSGGHEIGAAGGPDASFERTMGQLHQVLRGASNSRHQQRTDASTYQQNSSSENKNAPEPQVLWPNTQPWQDGQFVGTDAFAPAYAPDMTQLWLWDIEPNSDLVTDWSTTGHNV